MATDRTTRTLLLLVILLVASPALGRDFTVQLTIITDPEGATIYERTQPRSTLIGPQLPGPTGTPAPEPPSALPGSILLGQTPFVVRYTIHSGYECNDDSSLSLQWPSGAWTDVKTIRVCREDGTKQFITFARPNVPGREFDVAYALELQRLELLRQQIRNAEQAAQWTEALQILQNSRQRANTTVHCESYVVGNMVSTNCQ